MSTTYKIVGPLRIAGREPGEILTDEDLAEFDVAFLIETGHIRINKKGREATETQPEGEK